jgi:hypothetical protein
MPRLLQLERDSLIKRNVTGSNIKSKKKRKTSLWKSKDSKKFSNFMKLSKERRSKLSEERKLS